MSYRPVYLTIQEVIEIAALCDGAIGTARPITGGWHAIVAYPPGKCYVSDPDFSTSGYGRDHDHACSNLAAGVIRDLQGIGKYAPHWDGHAIRYRLLPYWRQRAADIAAGIDPDSRS